MVSIARLDQLSKMCGDYIQIDRVLDRVVDYLSDANNASADDYNKVVRAAQHARNEIAWNIIEDALEIERLND